jgi:hypothetical protein
MTFCPPGAVRALADSPHYPFVDSPQTRAATCAIGHREPLRPARPLDSGPTVRSIGRRFQPGAHTEGYAVAAMSTTTAPVPTFVGEHRGPAAAQVSLQTRLVMEPSVSDGQIITALLHDAADHDGGHWTVDPIRHGAARGLHPEHLLPER